MRKGKDPLVCLTAYDVQTARIADPYCDLLLVGDSLAMVVHGFPSTLAATLDMMSLHGAAVVRGAQQACVCIDMPFGSYEQSPEQAFASAAQLLAETGAQGVKLEGGSVMADTIRFLTQRGIPVLAHVGLTPQAVNSFGGFRAQGRDAQAADKITEDAKAVAEAGAFAVVIEAVMEPLARSITETIAIPTIGIGASAACDGQILVTEDALGVTSGRAPRFVRRFGDINGAMQDAVKLYAEEVRARRYPAAEHYYKAKS